MWEIVDTSEATGRHCMMMENVNYGREELPWRTFEHAKRNGNFYPTHGLGPIGQYMNLGRGEDNFGRIVSLSSPAKGRALYAKKSTRLSSPEFKKLEFKGGDINTKPLGIIISSKSGATQNVCHGGLLS